MVVPRQWPLSDATSKLLNRNLQKFVARELMIISSCFETFEKIKRIFCVIELLEVGPVGESQQMKGDNLGLGWWLSNVFEQHYCAPQLLSESGK